VAQPLDYKKPNFDPNSSNNDDTLMTVTTYTGVFVLGN
jgi:hypothetical protein